LKQQYELKLSSDQTMIGTGVTETLDNPSSHA